MNEQSNLRHLKPRGDGHPSQTGDTPELIPATPPPARVGRPVTPGPVGSKDQWSLSSKNYSVENFYTRATDGHGHSTKSYLTLSPILHAQIQHVIQSGKIPAYRTTADLIRDALIHRLRWVEDHYDGTVDFHDLEIEQRQAVLDKIALKREAWNHYLVSLEGELDGLIGNGEVDEAEWLLDSSEWNESMTTPYLDRLHDIIRGARERIRKARER